MGYGLDIHKTGQLVEAGGYVTTLRHVLVGGSTPMQIEQKMGFTPGSLWAGYWLLRLAAGTVVGTGDFEFRGYTHLEDGVPAGADRNVHDALMDRYSIHPADQQIKARVLQDGAKRLMADGLDRVCKVYPVNGDRMDYRPGSGVAQYKLTEHKPFEVIARVIPGEHLVALAPGEVRVEKI